MQRKEIVVFKEEGLNPENCRQLVALCCNYSSSIMIRRGSVFINAKSLMGVLSLAAGKNSILTFEADGKDERRVLKAIETFLAE